MADAPFKKELFVLEVIGFRTEEMWASAYIYSTQVIVATTVRFVMSKD